MERFTCKEIKQVVYILMNEPELKDKIFIAGGSVPWILSDSSSHRKHSDIDIVVEKDDMAAIRSYLKDKGYYHKETDSKYLSINKKQLDHGLEVFINHIPVNFAPFEVCRNNIIQRNFSLESLAGYDALLTATMENLDIEDYITTYTLENGMEIGAYVLEAVRAAKEKSNRDKDSVDLAQIEKIGINEERYYRIKESIQNMKIDVI